MNSFKRPVPWPHLTPSTQVRARGIAGGSEAAAVSAAGAALLATVAGVAELETTTSRRPSSSTANTERRFAPNMMRSQLTFYYCVQFLFLLSPGPQYSLDARHEAF